jgi:hypothetical protein
MIELESWDEEALVEALRLGGWMLANQALMAANGQTPMPLIAFARDGLASPQLLAPRTKSGVYDHQVIAGKTLIENQRSQARCWVLAYDRDLEDSGAASVVEVGAGESGPGITFSQRYTYGDEAGLKLLGDLEWVGQEFLPPGFQERLESLRWRYLLTEGATHHDLAGQRWSSWYSARNHQQVLLPLGEFGLTLPEGWFFRQTNDGNGWVIARLLPWEHREFEPTVVTMLLTYPGQATLENVTEKKRSQLLDRGDEVLKAEVFKLPSPSHSVVAGRLVWSGETEGLGFRSEWVWVPTDVPGRFLLFCATSFHLESWEGLLGALGAVLASLDFLEGRKGVRDGKHA